MLKYLNNLQTRTWFAIIAGIAILERLALYIFYRPVIFSDTASYRRSAEAVLGGWKLYDGTRTPGYPVFLALFGPDERVYVAQLVLGLLTTLLIFYIGWCVSGKGWFAALAALAHTFNLQQLFFEADLLTETLSTFFVILAFAGTAWLLFSEVKRPLWQILFGGLVTGLAGAAATLARPLFIFLPFWTAFFLVVFWRRATSNMRWGAALVTGLAGLALIGIWVNFIHTRYHMWSVSVMNGYHLVQHTGAFFEYVPDEYAALRDTYIQYRDAKIAATGSPTNAIWDAIPAMQKASGLSFYDLSRVLVGISIRLILEHPSLYLRSVAQGWLWFWKAPVYWSAEAVQNSSLRTGLGGLILAERGGMFAANSIFIAGSLALFWKKARQTLKMDTFLWFSLGTLWLTSIVQTLLDHGDNPRFSIPIQSIIVFMALWWIIPVTTRLTKRKV